MNMASSSVGFFLLFITLHRAGGFLYSREVRCVFNSTESKDIEFIDSYIYNKLELVRFSSKVGKFLGYTEFGVEIAERWNKGPFLEQELLLKDRYCGHNIPLWYNNVLTKTAQPYVILSSMRTPSGKHPGMLVCSAYDFYPKQIRVSWLRDGHKVPSEVTSTEELANGDWYYQVHSHLEYTPGPGEKISCVVEHASLKEPLIINWNETGTHGQIGHTDRPHNLSTDPSLPESERNKIAIGASGLILGLILPLAGFIHYKRKVKGWILVPTN